MSSPSSVEALITRVASDPELQRRFATAQDIPAVTEAVIAAGFDPTDPEISAALGLDEALDEGDLETTTGGFSYQGGFDQYGRPNMFGSEINPIHMNGGWGPGTSGGGPADAWA